MGFEPTNAGITIRCVNHFAIPTTRMVVRIPHHRLMSSPFLHSTCGWILRPDPDRLRIRDFCLTYRKYYVELIVREFLSLPEC